MSDVRKVSVDQVAKPKSSFNWPVWAAAALCVAYIVGVWVNNYRVSHAAAAEAAAIAAKK
jgi:hypothetical protein